MNKIKNILFIMADQLRFDYLSCYGHPHLKTPHLDGLAKKGVLFESAYVQAPVCGPSRASYYTGRTVFSHGSTWNQISLKFEAGTANIAQVIGLGEAIDYVQNVGIEKIYLHEKELLAYCLQKFN